MKLQKMCSDMFKEFPFSTIFVVMIYKYCLCVGMYYLKHEWQKYHIRYIERGAQLCGLYLLKTLSCEPYQ